jgi:hypothetical protein
MGARSHILVVDDDARLRNAAGKVDCQDSRSALPFWRNALDPIVETRMLWSHNGFSLKTVLDQLRLLAFFPQH